MMQKHKKVCFLTVGGALEILLCWTQSTMYTVLMADLRNVFNKLGFPGLLPVSVILAVPIGYSGGLAKIKKDMIIRGGENIQPTEIENYFHSHPGIEDIYVIGVPSKRLGEEVAAYISVPVISDYELAIFNH